jgi:hypothetical protein
LAISLATISRNIRRRKIAISLAALAAAAFGLPLFLSVERPGEHTASGFLTHFRRGWCHTPFLLFNQSLCGVLVMILDGIFWRVDG